MHTQLTSTTKAITPVCDKQYPLSYQKAHNYIYITHRLHLKTIYQATVDECVGA